MHIVVFNGSPRGAKGNTHFIVAEFLKGAEQADATTENIFLSEKKVHYCLGCFNCWLRTPGTCAIRNDDMEQLLETYRRADVVVFATPLYVDNVSGLMKNFMDRLIPLAEPFFAKDARGECRHVLRSPKRPKMMVISNSGFPEESHFAVLKLLFRRVALNFQAELAGEIYRPAGELLSVDNILLKPILARYKSHLRDAGAEFVKAGRLSEKTMASLAKPLVPETLYISGANKSFKQALDALGS